MEVVLKRTISRSNYEEMSQQSNSTVLPPCRGNGENRTAGAASSVRISSGPAVTATSLSLSKTPSPISPAEAGVATSTQPDSPRCALPTNPHLGTIVSSVPLFAPSDIRDHPATAEREDQRSTGHDQTGVQGLKPSDPSMAVIGDSSIHNHGQDHAVPKSSGHVSGTSIPTLAPSTSAQMLPPRAGSLNKSKSIWAPGWVQQPEDGWKESLRRGSSATVSPRTKPVVKAGGIAQPVTQLVEPSKSLHTQKVDKSVQKTGLPHSEDTEIEYPAPKVALMAYLDRLAKEKAERTLSMDGKDHTSFPDERVTEPVYPPVRKDSTQGRERVMRTYEQSETDTDVDLAEPKRGPPRDCQPGLERNVYPTLPSFAHMLESAGLTNDEHPLLPWEYPDSYGHERSVFTPTRSHNYESSAGSLLQQTSHKMSAANRETVKDLTKNEFIMKCRRENEQSELEWAAYVNHVLATTPKDQDVPWADRGMVDTQVKAQPPYDGQVHQCEHLLATNFNQSVANLPNAQDLPTTNRGMGDDQSNGLPPYRHYFQSPRYANVDTTVVHYPSGSNPATNQGMINAQLQLQSIEANHLRRIEYIRSEYIRKHFRKPMDSVPEAQEMPAVNSGQPSDSSAATDPQHAAPAHLENYAPISLQHTSPAHLGSYAPTGLQHAPPSRIQHTKSNYLDRYAPAHLQSALQDAAPSQVERHASSHLQHATPARLDRQTPSHLQRAASSQLQHAATTHLDRHAPSHLQRTVSQQSSDAVSYLDKFRFDPEPQYHNSGFGLEHDPFKTSYGRSTQQSSQGFVRQAQEGHNAASLAPENPFRPSFVQSGQQSLVPVASQGSGQHEASSSVSQPFFHPGHLQSPFSQVGPFQPGMLQGSITPSTPFYASGRKHGRTESDASQAQSAVQSSYGAAYGKDVDFLTRVHGQSAVGNTLQSNIAFDNRNYGQGAFANPSFQTASQPYQPYGEGSPSGSSQPNPARPIQVSGLNTYTNFQTQGAQPQQYPQVRPVARGRARNWSAKDSHEPAAQIPLYVSPNWNRNQQPGATGGTWTMQQYTDGNSQQPQQQAPFGPADPSSPLFAVGAMNQMPALGPIARGPVEPSYNYQASNSMPPSKRVRHYRPGGDAMYPHIGPGPSAQYQALTYSGHPSLEVAAQGEAMPFVEGAKETGPADWGVIKVGNIPYSVTKQEIMAFLGRNAKIITPDLGVAIHIIMERSTSKTMDCFVEFLSYGDALAVVNKFTRNREDGRHPRVGDRHVAVEMSGQDVLMKELFPRAKNVVWQGGNPVIMHNDEPFNSGFKSFLTSEEMVMLVKHAEQPHRSPFSQKCLQRTYESLISTLEKYPWWCTNLYTVGDRDLLFGATEQQIRALVTQVKRGGAPGLTRELLAELVYAGLNAPGFSDSQRAKLVAAAEPVVQGICISPLAAFWPFEVLSRRENVQEDVVEYYAGILREATTSTALVPLGESSAHGGPRPGPSPFGNVTVPWPVENGRLKMAVAAGLEWGVLEALLRKVLGGGRDPSGSR